MLLLEPLPLSDFGGHVVDALPPEVRGRQLEDMAVYAAVVPPPFVIAPFHVVVDELPPRGADLRLDDVLTPVEPPHLIVPYFEATYPDFFERASEPYDVIELVQPPEVPVVPGRRSAGYGAAGGGGGWYGEVYRFCEDEDDQGRRVVRRARPGEVCEEPVLEDLGDAESPAAGIASVFGHGVAGYVGSKAITRAVEKRFGKHAGAAAAIVSVVATAKATDKLAEKSDRFKRLGTMVFGSVVAAVDDLVDIYVNERGKTPVVEAVKDAATIVARAQETKSLVVTKRMGTKRSTRQRVMVLRYVSLQEKHTPPTMYVYQEVVPIAADGQFYLRGTLLELIRRAKPRG